MTKILYPPMAVPEPAPNLVNVFLAGSIEMGSAVDWQALYAAVLEPLPAVGQIYNPRRPSWDKNTPQRADNKEFADQVNWELDNIEKADIVYFHFEGHTQSPISMAELGYVLGRLQPFSEFPQEIIVYCPETFWRQANMEIMCRRASTAFSTEFTSKYSTVRFFTDVVEARKILVQRVWAKHKAKSGYHGYFYHDNGMESQREKKVPLELRGLKIPKNFELE